MIPCSLPETYKVSAKVLLLFSKQKSNFLNLTKCVSSKFLRKVDTYIPNYKKTIKQTHVDVVTR